VDVGQETRSETPVLRPWTGVLGLLDADTGDHRRLTLPPLGVPEHWRYPLPLSARTADADLLTVCGTIWRVWRSGDTLRGCGRVEVDPNTSWGQRLLRGVPQPVGVSLSHIQQHERNAAWWHPLARLVGADKPKTMTFHAWHVRGAVLHDEAAWPDAYITLDDLDTGER
jgi:hypothetical protein